MSSTSELPIANSALPAALADRVPHRLAYFETYGCQMNKLDSELAEQALAAAGFASTAEVSQADLIVLNTCSVRDHAEHRVLSRLGVLKPGGTNRKEGAVLALIGCMGQRQGADLFKAAPHLDIVAGTTDFIRLPELYAEVVKDRRHRTALDLASEFEYARDPRFRSEHHRAFVSIMRGCDLHCTYCIVPTTRGPEVSVPLQTAVDEVRRLVDDGVSEVTLLGQTVNSWGKQLKGEPDLGDLLAELDQIAGLKRTRFITSHPNFFQNRFWERVRDLRTFCPYVHVPLQHGADRVLKRMARLYTVSKYREMVDEAREAIPDVALASDWIVGFPGETEAEHEQSMARMREFDFFHSYVFKYSPRPNTPSERRMDDDIPREVKDRRCNELLAIQTDLSQKHNDALVGQTLEVLVDGESKKNPARLSGRTRLNRVALFDRPDDHDLAGKMVLVKIVRVTAHSLYGDLAGRPAEEPRKLPIC
ncbi:MAG: tRNA (N6-isopentenyl adenosine(37)-C2)-methylthiotransferase MiaB [Planctomycetes bacterium]|nr:tRNA (N6-isopentenyl adenosine(37)-C2)-methylthiotransferase MiaB [Planctomycetota bacterium]